MSLLDIPYLILLVTHGVAAWYDYKTREIPDKVWIGAMIAASFTIYVILHSSIVDKILYLSNLIAGLALASLCYIFKIVGGADIKSIIAIALSCPPLVHISNSLLLTVLNLPTIAVVSNAIIVVVLYTLYIVFKNLKTFDICTKKYVISSARKIILFITALCVPVKEVLKNHHKYAVILDRDPKLVSLYRICLEDPRDLLKSLVEKGKTNPEDYVLAVYYMPYIVCIFVGLLIYYVAHLSVAALVYRSIATLIMIHH